MWLAITNSTTQLLNFTPEEREFVAGYLSFEDDKARFTRGGDRLCLLSSWNNNFPTGFVPLVQKAAIAEGFKVDLIDKRVKPCEFDKTADLAWLRDYQLEAVKRIVARTRGICSQSTGSGKTEIATALARALPCKWLFVVHRVGLAHQAADRFELRAKEHGIYTDSVGRIGEGAWSVGDRYTCATFATLHDGLKAKSKRVIDLLNSIDGFIVDECHTIPSISHLNVTSAMPNAYWRIGLSGTPLARGDKKSIYALGAIGPVIHKITSEQLIQEGVLARPKVRMSRCVQKIASTIWSNVYMQGVTDSRTRNALLVQQVLRAEKPALVFVKGIPHGKLLTRMILQAGVRADFAYGDHSVDYRNSMCARLKSGSIDVLVASVIFNEGIDLPFLRSVIMGAGGKSMIETLQRLGRGMRIEKNAQGNVIKDTFELWDVLDEGNKWLAKHARERRQAYLNQGFEVIVE